MAVHPVSHTAPPPATNAPKPPAHNNTKTNNSGTVVNKSAQPQTASGGSTGHHVNKTA